MSDSLSDRIRKKIKNAATDKTEEYTNLLPEEKNEEASLEPDFEPDPDTDKDYFSEVRRDYETSLDTINDSLKTAEEFADTIDLDHTLQSLNNLMAALPWKPKRGFVRKIMAKIVSLGIGSEMDSFKQALAETTHVLNILNHKTRIFSGKQESFNSELAIFGQRIVPVIDEKNRYSQQKYLKLLQEHSAFLLEHATFLKDRMDVFHENTDKRQTEISNWLHNLVKRLDSFEDRLGLFDNELKRGIALQHRKLEQFLQNTPKIAGAAPGETAGTNHREDNTSGLGDYGYYLFETEGRGPEKFVKMIQQDYIPFFLEASPVLDIGCGRGEFLELLRDAGIQALGIDTNSDMVEICRQKNLDVTRQDALNALESYEPGSLGGIFAGQLIEHIPSEKVLRWLAAAHNALKPGGVLVFETVNTSSLFALVSHYFKDPTHQLPRHPDTYKFLTEIAGFKNVTVHYRSPVPKDAQLSLPELPEPLSDDLNSLISGIKSVIDQLNNLIFAPCDIAVYANKGNDR